MRIIIASMPFSTLFFDLDDTIYPAHSGLWEAIRDRMGQYMWEQLRLPKEEVPQIRKMYFETYGTTLRGLQIHYQIDVDDYLAYVHDVPLTAYIHPDPSVREMLLSLPQPKWIFTNADDRHAHRVLDLLQLSDCFQGIIDIRATGFACKPEKEAYRQAMLIAGESDPQRCLMIDDSTRNLQPAHELGFFTVWVGSSQTEPAVDRYIQKLLDLPQALPELWESSHQEDNE